MLVNVSWGEFLLVLGLILLLYYVILFFILIRKGAFRIPSLGFQSDSVLRTFSKSEGLMYVDEKLESEIRAFLEEFQKKAMPLIGSEQDLHFQLKAALVKSGIMPDPQFTHLLAEQLRLLSGSFPWEFRPQKLIEFLQSLNSKKYEKES